METLKPFGTLKLKFKIGNNNNLTNKSVKYYNKDKVLLLHTDGQPRQYMEQWIVNHSLLKDVRVKFIILSDLIDVLEIR